MRRAPAGVLAALAVLAAAGVAAAFSPWLVPGATAQDLMTGITGPGPGHPLGTDDLGRDVLQLLVAGARTAVPGALAVTAGSALVGNLIGLAAGYFGGWMDTPAMRWTDLMLSLPALLVAIVVAASCLPRPRHRSPCPRPRAPLRRARPQLPAAPRPILASPPRRRSASGPGSPARR